MTRADCDRWMMRLLPALVFAGAAAPFLPALANGWVGWDDPLFLLDNPFYRGLGAAQLRWMFEGPHFGQYFPVAWLTLGFDYAVWGMEAGGYHLTSVLIHAGTAVLFYFAARRLFAAGAPAAPAGTRALAAAFAALAFAVHPLRVESVAWAVERRDVLSAFFYAAAVLCYLRACAATAAAEWRWRGAALAAYACSLLSKATGVTLPVALLIIDAYPLGRLGLDPRRWSARDAAVLREKVPFALLAAAGAAAGWAGLRSNAELSGFAEFGLSARVAQASYATGFYLAKTVWPSGLSPDYEAPSVFRLAEPRFAAALAGVLAAAAAVWAGRRWFPALAAAALFYAATLAPVSGLVRAGMNSLAADRFSLLPSFGLALLLGAASLAGLRRARGASLAATSAVLVLWSALSWRQTGHWRDSSTLWRRALAVEPDNSIATLNLAVALAEQGDRAGALENADRAARLRPADPDAVENLGAALLAAGRARDAADAFLRAAALKPSSATLLMRAGIARAASGEFADAERLQRAALRLDDGDAAARYQLGNALARQGRRDEAAAQYERVLRDDPDFARARVPLGQSYAQAGRADAAVAQFRAALRSPDDAAAAQYEWGRLCAARGDGSGAVRHYREAARLDPALLEARFNLANVLARAGAYRDAAWEYRVVLARDPRFAGAAENLAKVSTLGGR